MSDEQQTPQESPAPELDREKRRLARLRLVTDLWQPENRFDDPDPEPDQAA